MSALVLLAAGLLAGDLQEIKQRGQLRVLVVSGSSAFYSVPDSAAGGLDRELLDGFARLHQLEIKTVEVATWQELVPALREGRGELIAGGVTASEKRKQLIDFTVEVFPTRHVVLTRKPHRVIRTLEELRTERVGTIKGTSMAEAVASARVPPANVVEASPADDLQAGLQANRYTAYVDGLEIALAAQQEDPALQMGLFVGPRETLAFGVRKDEPELLRVLNEYLTNVRKTPTWSRLVVKYFGASALGILKAVDQDQLGPAALR